MNSLKSILILTFLFSAVSVFSQPKDRYGFSSAYIEKSTETITAGNKVSTDEKIYIKGNKEARYIKETTNISMMAQDHSNVSNKVVITDPDWIITYDPETREGTKMKNTFTDQFSGMSEENMKKMAEQMGEALKTNVKDGGTGIVAGKECKITIAETDLMGMKTTSKIWSYKNFEMKVESNTGGNIIKAVVNKFEENVTIDHKNITVPSDVSINVVESPF